MKALEWLKQNGGGEVRLGGATELLAHVEKYHPVTDELSEYTSENLPEKSVDIDTIRILSGDDIIELSDSIDEFGFLISLGYIIIGEFDDGVIVMNANDASVHMLNTESLDLTKAEFDEGSEEYFWEGEGIEESSDDFEMAFEESSTGFESFEEFDEKLTGALNGEMEWEELGI